jgi:uncharacterized repeat protein (TIGR03803 family)
MKRLLTALIVCVLACLAYSRATEAQTETVVYSFCSQPDCWDGEYPSNGLIDENGTLYGTTLYGGAGYCYQNQQCGTMFSLNLQSGVQNLVYSFCSQEGCADGQVPSAAVLDVNGTLYGTTQFGGGNPDCYEGLACGTIFSLDPQTRVEKVLYSFCSQNRCRDGIYPAGGLINIGSLLYGSTSQGGDCRYGSGCGTLFSFDLTSAAEKVLYAFCVPNECTDGAYPSALVDVNGTLYGTTSGGGAGVYCHRNRRIVSSCGTVFSLNPATGAVTFLYSFCSQRKCKDGKEPEAGVINANGTLYGTTASGGSKGAGTVFSLNPATGGESVLYSFCSQANCADGEYPDAGLIEINGALYGTTIFGGAYGHGAVFSLDPETGTETVLYSFCSQANCADGAAPWSSLSDVNGTLYGMTEEGGTGENCTLELGCGTVFSITP